MKVRPKFGTLLVQLFLSMSVISCMTNPASSQQARPQPAAEEKTAAPTKGNDPSQWNKLTAEEERVIVHKGTEWAGTGEYTDNKAAGTYVCRRCNAELYKSTDKFDSRCGWPSFDDTILPDAVKRVPDADGRRTEIVCANCGGHLGHVFEGEGFTAKDTRHCVNSISMRFIPAAKGGE